MKLSITIPTRNEEGNIKPLLSQIWDALVPYKPELEYEVIVVDDGDDKTSVLARHYGAKVLKGKRMGLSQAVIDGIKASDGDVVAVMDADLQHPPDALPSMVKALKVSDFVVMSRYVDGGGCAEWDTDRKLYSRFANLVARPLVPRVHDLASGFFGFRRDRLFELDGINVQGFKIMLELLVKGNWGSIAEVPYTFYPRQHGDSKMRFEQVREYALQLARLYYFKLRS